MKKEQIGFLWFSSSKRGVNASGMAVFPAGVRSKRGFYIGKGTYTDIWSGTEFNSEKSWSRSLTWIGVHPAKTKIHRKAYDKKWGFSVRCIKNQE